jgi:hypothetical protein
MALVEQMGARLRPFIPRTLHTLLAWTVNKIYVKLT